MATLSVKNSTHSTSILTPGAWYTFTPSADVYISIGTQPTGDATLDNRSAHLAAGGMYQFFVPPGSVILDGLSPRPAANAVPDTCSFINVGSSPVAT